MTDDVRPPHSAFPLPQFGRYHFMTVIVMVGPLVLYVDNKPVAGRFFDAGLGICSYRPPVPANHLCVVQRTRSRTGTPER